MTYKDNTPLTVATIMLLIVVVISVVAVIITTLYIMNRRLRGHPATTNLGGEIALS